MVDAVQKGRRAPDSGFGLACAKSVDRRSTDRRGRVARIVTGSVRRCRRQQDLGVVSGAGAHSPSREDHSDHPVHGEPSLTSGAIGTVPPTSVGPTVHIGAGAASDWHRLRLASLSGTESVMATKIPSPGPAASTTDIESGEPPRTTAT